MKSRKHSGGRSGTPSSEQESGKSSSSSSSQQQSSSSKSSSSYESQMTVPISGTDFPDEEDFSCDWVWGWMIPLKNWYPYVDLERTEYVFGRFIDEGNNNLISFRRKCFPECERDKLFLNHSLKHFEIQYKRKDSKVFIKDISSNGTYVNKILVGRGKQNVLESGDIISLGLPNNEAYQFFSKSSVQAERKSLPPEFVRKYKLLAKRLGSGACGEVRDGVEISSGKPLAIKIIAKRMSLANVQDFEYEANLMKSLDHPCVVKIFDVFESPEKYYFVMERVNGGELFDRVKTKVDAGIGVAEDLARFWFYQMMKTVEYLHSQNVTHRDIKPENILLTSPSDDWCLLKITDFGMSRIVNATSVMRTYVGTLNYIAPEVIKAQYAEGGYTKICDCWSLGCVLFVCLGGYQPFSEDGSSPIVQQILTSSFTMHGKHWDVVSEAGKDLVKQLLKPDPTLRITVSQSLKHPWLHGFGLEEELERAIRKQESSENADSQSQHIPSEHSFGSRSSGGSRSTDVLTSAPPKALVRYREERSARSDSDDLDEQQPPKRKCKDS